MYYFKNKKTKQKKRKEEVCSSTKSIFDKERRDFLSLLQKKKMDAFTILNFRSYRVEKFRFLKPN